MQKERSEEEKNIPEYSTPKLPKVHQNFNQMALDAIRKSLTSKISVQEELTDKDDEDVEKIIQNQKKPLVKTSSNTSSTFEANRASVANALLGFNRRPSTKVYFMLHRRFFLNGLFLSQYI